MASVTVSLPAQLQAFIDAEVAAKGYASASEYIGLLVHKAQLEKQRSRIDSLLREWLKDGPATPLTAQDWKAIEQQGLARLSQ